MVTWLAAHLVLKQLDPSGERRLVRRGFVGWLGGLQVRLRAGACAADDLVLPALPLTVRSIVHCPQLLTRSLEEADPPPPLAAAALTLPPLPPHGVPADPVLEERLLVRYAALPALRHDRAPTVWAAAPGRRLVPGGRLLHQGGWMWAGAWSENPKF